MKKKQPETVKCDSKENRAAKMCRKELQKQCIMDEHLWEHGGVEGGKKEWVVFQDSR